MIGMFQRCSSLTTLDVSSWDVTNVTYMDSMFYGCSLLTTLDVSKWDTSSVTNMNSMFRDCSSLTTLDVSKWDITSIQPYNNNNSMYLMFTNCPLSTEFYDAALISWSQQNVKTGVRLDANLAKYSSLAANARKYLRGTKGWSIIDGGQVV